MVVIWQLNFLCVAVIILPAFIPPPLHYPTKKIHQRATQNQILFSALSGFKGEYTTLVIRVGVGVCHGE